MYRNIFCQLSLYLFPCPTLATSLVIVCIQNKLPVINVMTPASGAVLRWGPRLDPSGLRFRVLGADTPARHSLWVPLPNLRPRYLLVRTSPRIVPGTWPLTSHTRILGQYRLRVIGLSTSTSRLRLTSVVVVLCLLYMYEYMHDKIYICAVYTICTIHMIC